MTGITRRSFLQAASSALALVACEEEQSDEQPEDVARLFVDQMRRVHGDRRRALAAYELLWSRDQKILAERARRGSAVAGRKMGPEEMIAPSRFTLSFEPQSFETEKTEGRKAIVVVRGRRAGQIARVTCVFEEQRWRVVLNLPEPPPIRKRAR